jgi:nicotinamide-nucleotide amidase
MAGAWHSGPVSIERPRAGIVVTGTEVLTGRVADANGPWLAEQLRAAGVDVGQIVVVGDRPQDLTSALTHLAAGHQLVITTGGLGPTADDLTAAVVADFQRRPMALDPELEERIGAIVGSLMARWAVRHDPAATAAGVRKQALVPAGATALGPAGTAPALVVPAPEGTDGPPVVVLPGPPSELRASWVDAVAAPEVRAVLAGAPPLRQETIRLWAMPESELAATLRRIEDDVKPLEITTCLRDGELEIVSRFAPQDEAAQQALAAAIRADFGDALFSPDGTTVDELIARGLSGRGWTAAIADRATGGHLPSRLIRRGGRFVGAQVSTALEPVSADAALALATGIRDEFDVAVGLGLTAIADGAVHLAVVTPDGGDTRSLTGAEPVLRRRVEAAALHLLLPLVQG